MKMLLLILIACPLLGSEPKASLLSETRHVLLGEVIFKSIKIADLIRYFEIEYNHNVDRRLQDVHPIRIDGGALPAEIRAMEIDFACTDLPITGVLNILSAKYGFVWQSSGFEVFLSDAPAPSSVRIVKKYECDDALIVNVINTGGEVVLSRGTIEIIYERVGGVWKSAVPASRVPGDITLKQNQSAVLVAKKNSKAPEAYVGQVLVEDKPIWLYFEDVDVNRTSQPKHGEDQRAKKE